MIILNVGLKIDALGDEFNTVEICHDRARLAQAYFVRLGYAPVWLSIRQSETELTAIITLQSDDWKLPVYIGKLADMLGQDCISVYWRNTDYGRLIGINADKWGEFNKDYFLMP